MTAQLIIADDIVRQYAANLPSVRGYTKKVNRAYLQQWSVELLMDIDSAPGGTPEFLFGPEVKVFVTPNGQEITRNSRSTVQVDYKFLIGVGAKVRTICNEEVDPFVAWLETMQDYWISNGILNRKEMWISSEQVAFPDFENLRTKLLFVGAFELTFRGFR